MQPSFRTLTTRRFYMKWLIPIAGLTITDERVAQLTKEATGSVPDALQTTNDKWSLSFAWNQPVTVEFDDQKLTITIRARRLTSGETKLEFGRRGGGRSTGPRRPRDTRRNRRRSRFSAGGWLNWWGTALRNRRRTSS